MKIRQAFDSIIDSACPMIGVITKVLPLQHLFIHNDIRKLHVVSDIDLAIACQVAEYTACANDLHRYCFRVVVTSLSGIDADRIGVAEDDLIVVFLFVVISFYFRNKFYTFRFAREGYHTIIICYGRLSALGRFRDILTAQCYLILEVLPRFSIFIIVQ